MAAFGHHPLPTRRNVKKIKKSKNNIFRIIMLRTKKLAGGTEEGIVLESSKMRVEAKV